jgi:Uma2 family endonuclease
MPGLRPPMTADELLALYSSGTTLEKHELAQGQLVVMEPPGSMHGLVSVSIALLLKRYARKHAPGSGVFVETGFLLSTHPDTVRAPDVSFVTANRMQTHTRESLKTYFPGPPDVAVEVVSPSDRWRDIEEKIADHFAYGTQLLWIVDPQRQCVIVRTPDGRSQLFTEEDDVIDGGTILPQFAATVKMLLSTS